MQHIKAGYICVKVNPKNPGGIFESCLEDPEEHEKVFQHDWYNTGDKATRDDEGVLYVRGRGGRYHQDIRLEQGKSGSRGRRI